MARKKDEEEHGNPRQRCLLLVIPIGGERTEKGNTYSGEQMAERTRGAR